MRTFEAVGCEGLARVDVFVTPDGEVVVNEINTMPGFTPFSMYPRMWEASGRRLRRAGRRAPAPRARASDRAALSLWAFRSRAGYASVGRDGAGNGATAVAVPAPRTIGTSSGRPTAPRLGCAPPGRHAVTALRRSVVTVMGAPHAASPRRQLVDTVPGRLA